MIYDVTLPITGYLITSVEAESEDDAIQKALASELTIEMVESWEAVEQIVRGNIFCGQRNCAQAEGA